MTSLLRPSVQAKAESSARRNALGIAALVLFAVFVVAQILTGHQVYNQDQLEHGSQTVSLVAYFGEGHLWEAIFENWESEFLQMGAYILLTVYLVQKGSAESKDPDGHDPVDEDPRDADLRRNVPWPVRRGGVWLTLYENSLLLAFAALFLASMLGHALGGLAEHNSELREHGQAAMSFWNYVSGAQFWFESFQNWQSEFLAVFAIVMLTIWLRQRGSSESKPVAAPHDATGTG